MSSMSSQPADNPSAAAARGPLVGLRVIDFSSALSGPFCTLLLAEMGADVVKVEPPEGDPLRDVGVMVDQNRSLHHLLRHRNKKSILVDLKKPGGIAVARRLIAGADAVAENFRPGVMDRLGLGYESLAAINPRLIYCAISGFGSSGPHRDLGAYDVVIQAMSGLMTLVGEEDGPLTGTGFLISDMVTGLHAALGITAAVIERERSGLGQKVDLSLLDSTLSLCFADIAKYALTGELPVRRGASTASNSAPWGVFRTSDGHITIATPFQHQWEQLSRLLGLEHLLQDPRFITARDRGVNRKELHAIVQSVVEHEPTDVWFQRISDAGMPAAPVNTFDRLLADPHIQERQSVIEVRDGDVAVTIPNTPIRFSRTPGKIRTLGAQPGEHSATVLAEAGYSEEEIAALFGGDVVR